MIRREFLQVLGSLPFLGFLKRKEEPEGLTIAKLMEVKKQLEADSYKNKWIWASGPTQTTTDSNSQVDVWGNEPDLYTFDDGEPI